MAPNSRKRRVKREQASSKWLQPPRIETALSFTRTFRFQTVNAINSNSPVTLNTRGVGDILLIPLPAVAGFHTCKCAFARFRVKRIEMWGSPQATFNGAQVSFLRRGYLVDTAAKAIQGERATKHFEDSALGSARVAHIVVPFTYPASDMGWNVPGDSTTVGSYEYGDIQALPAGSIVDVTIQFYLNYGFARSELAPNTQFTAVAAGPVNVGQLQARGLDSVPIATTNFVPQGVGEAV